MSLFCLRQLEGLIEDEESSSADMTADREQLEEEFRLKGCSASDVEDLG